MGQTVGLAADADAARRFLAQSNNDAASAAHFVGRPKIANVGADGQIQRARRQLAVSTEEVSDRDAQQHMRRTSIIESMFQDMAVRLAAGPSARILSITWEEFHKLFKEYADAARQGRARDCAFQPLSSYAHKKIGRPIIEREVGVLQLSMTEGKIVQLQDRGPGDHGEKYFVVGIDFAKGKDETVKMYACTSCGVLLAPCEHMPADAEGFDVKEPS
jgi:hypothetical protein